jgi:glycosyltransferase involved in cell wall biosynthesis
MHADGGIPPKPNLVSVIMPVRDEQEFVAEQLAALAAQTYRAPWELLVVDNGCADGTIEVVDAWANRIPALTVVDARAKRGLNRARNAGVAAARGDFLVFCDGDNVAATGWLEAMARASARGHLVRGIQDVLLLNDDIARTWSSRPLPPLDDRYRFLPSAPGGNLGLWATIARELGWDEDFTFGGSDIEFAWRAQLSSYRLVVAEDAVMHRRLQRRLTDLARQYYAYGKAFPQLYRRFRTAGMPPPDLRDARRSWWWLIRRSPDLWRSGTGRGRWVRVAAERSGRLAGSARFRTIAP